MPVLGPRAGGSQGWPWLCWTQGILGALGVRPGQGARQTDSARGPSACKVQRALATSSLMELRFFCFPFFVSCVCDASFCKCKREKARWGWREKQREGKTDRESPRDRHRDGDAERKIQRRQTVTDRGRRGGRGESMSLLTCQGSMGAGSPIRPVPSLHL